MKHVGLISVVVWTTCISIGLYGSYSPNNQLSRIEIIHLALCIPIFLLFCGAMGKFSPCCGANDRGSVGFEMGDEQIVFIFAPNLSPRTLSSYYPSSISYWRIPHLARAATGKSFGGTIHLLFL
jgi:hypothetical protein